MTGLRLVRPYSEAFQKPLVAPLWKDPRTMASPDLWDTQIGGKAPGRDRCVKFPSLDECRASFAKFIG